MLQLRQDQFDSLAASWFERRLVKVIDDNLPGKHPDVSADAGNAFLREQMVQARRYGLVAELDVARFVITAWLLGANFDTRLPAFAEILNDPQLTPSQKSKAIELIASDLLATLRASAPPATPVTPAP